MRIVFHKLTNDRHALEIIRDDARRERVECETRSYLEHDLLHYAVEAEAVLESGFWGSLAGGKTLAEMNDRAAPAYPTAEGMVIEQVVGAMSALMKGQAPEQLVPRLTGYTRSLGQEPPRWLTVSLAEGVRERMRRLLGQWKATPFGETMELTWPPKRDAGER